MELQRYWFILKRHWLPALAVFGSALGIAALITFLSRPQYLAEGQLLFKSNDSATSLSLSDLAAGDDRGKLSALGKQVSPVDTEAQVVVSIPLLQKVIAIEELEKKPDLIDQIGAFLQTGKSDVPIEPADPSGLLKKIVLRHIPSTDVLAISYQNPDPQKVASVVNTLMAVYLENNISTNRAEAVAARDFIEQQLPKTEATVRKAEAALRAFKEKNRVINLEEESKSSVGVISSLENQLAQAQAQLGDASARSESLRGKVGMSSQEALVMSALSQSPAVQQALTDFQKAESELELQRARYQEGHPTITNLKSKSNQLQDLLNRRVREVIGKSGVGVQGSGANLRISDLDQKLVENLVLSEVDRQGSTNRVSSLTNERDSYKRRVNVLPRLEQEQAELQRRLDVSQVTYRTLLQKLQEVQVAEKQNVGNARIIVPAIAPDPDKPDSPSVVINLGIGTVLGALLAFALALVLELRDKSVKTVSETRELFGYTLLGVIPAYGDDKLIVREAPRSSFSEAYRMLQANLRFLSSDNTLKVIVVTSSVPGEGKSTVSANLSLAIAELGRRVLLVDADMRRPSQHKIWDLTNVVGLSNVIVGEADFATSVERTMPNLHILTAGVVPPNALALLDSKRMASLIEQFSLQYDYVIIDTPSTAVAADAPVLGKMSDGILFVSRPGVVDSSSAVAAKELMAQSNQNILGHVINGVMPENEPDSYYYYAKEYYGEESTAPNKVAKSGEKRNVRS